MTDTDVLIRAKSLYKRFDNGGVGVEILKDMDFVLNAGETVAIVGPSGIGKSTLLHILGTLDRPDKGHLFYNNEDVFRFDSVKLSKFRNETIGFVFQFHHLLPEFSAIENAMMPAVINGLNKQIAKDSAEELLIRVGLENRLHFRVNELSGGEQQRVALARALVMNPAVLLGDEPTGNLDVKNSRQVHQLFLELNQELGMTLVVVTHNMELAACMSRRVTIAEGQIFELD